MCRNKHKPCRHNQPFDGVIERFFGRLPLHSTPPSNRATGLSRKPQVVGEQNESVAPRSRRRERAGVIPGQPAGLNPESGDDQREIPGSRQRAPRNDEAS